MIHFAPTSKMFHALFDQNSWLSTCFKTCPSFQSLNLFLKSSGRIFEALIENRKPLRYLGKLNRVFENHGQASKKLTLATCLCSSTSHDVHLTHNILLTQIYK